MRTRRIFATVLATMLATIAALANAQPASAGTTTCSVYAIKAANGLWVAAEMGYGGADYAMLRARSSSIGAYENFRICWRTGYGDDYATIQSMYNYQYVTAEIGYGGSNQRFGMLRAARSSVGPWEKFGVDLNSPGQSIIKSYAGLNHCMVQAELDYPGMLDNMLRADGACQFDKPTTREKYTIKDLS